jgi:hypothetical protein
LRPPHRRKPTNAERYVSKETGDYVQIASGRLTLYPTGRARAAGNSSPSLVAGARDMELVGGVVERTQLPPDVAAISFAE